MAVTEKCVRARLSKREAELRALARQRRVKAPVLVVGRAGRHGVTDVVLADPGNRRARLHFDLLGLELKSLDVDCCAAFRAELRRQCKQQNRRRTDSVAESHRLVPFVTVYESVLRFGLAHNSKEILSRGGNPFWFPDRMT